MLLECMRYISEAPIINANGNSDCKEQNSIVHATVKARSNLVAYVENYIKRGGSLEAKDE